MLVFVGQNATLTHKSVKLLGLLPEKQSLNYSGKFRKLRAIGSASSADHEGLDMQEATFEIVQLDVHTWVRDMTQELKNVQLVSPPLRPVCGAH